MKRILFEKFLSIPKSLFVCYKLFGIKKAFSLPLLVCYNTRGISLKGNVKCVGGGRILIGFGNISEFDKKYERSIIKFNGNITFETPCKFGPGVRLISEYNSNLYIGSNFINTAGLTISNRGTIIIGKDCLVSWKTWICDTDFHKIIDMKRNNQQQPNGVIKIGNHVWICANSTILKGSIIGNDIIVASNSLVKGLLDENNCIIAGSPAVIKKREVCWDI